MRLVRASWLIVLAVIIVTAAVPALRRLPRIGLYALVPGKDIVQQPDAPIRAMLKPYQERAAAFVEERYPNDPEMLLAAGVITEDADLLKRAAETANTPLAWAAYLERLAENAPAFERIGSSGVNPADAAAVAQEEKRIAESGLPDRLTPEQAEPVLSMLRRWQEADPENALPVAVEARYLYGLHQDADALIAWSQAGRMPLVTSHAVARADAVRRLLTAMGLPEPEALLNSQILLVFPSFARLRDNARFAVYEGRLAAMRDDPVTAITWWQSTADFGLHMQESTDTIIGFLVGAAVQSIGTAPAWRWEHDDRTGLQGGPLLGGRIFYGAQHQLYAAHMGARKDQELRDALILGKLRTQVSRGYTRGGGMFEGYLTAARYLAFAAMILVQLLVIFLAVGAWSRRAADEATDLRPAWQLIMAAAIVLPPVAVLISALRIDPTDDSWLRPFVTQASIAALASGLALILLPLLAALRSRAPGARLLTAWRGNLRRLLPVAIALSALLFLGLSAYAARLRAGWSAKWSAPGVTEMSDMVQTLGDEWSDPTIPPDAWRLEHPPGALR